MKLDYLSEDLEIENIGAEFRTKDAKISSKNLPYIFALLSKIYSNRIGSIVREIASNCVDAHVRANKPNEPIIIRLFIDDTNQHHIEFHDNGTGMSVKTMDEVYMSYGESDKRHTDDEIGGFGLGSKSPFSYTNYFYVITRVDGIEYTYLLNSTKKGPEYNCLLENECSKDSNGTIVRIPIQKDDYPKWCKELKNQLRYFNNTYVVGFENFINDYQIKSFDSFKMRKDVLSSRPEEPLHIAIGNAMYPINFLTIEERIINFNAALTFKVGELDVIPNREEIEYSDSTIEKIKSKIKEFKEEITNIFLNECNFVFNNFFEFKTAKQNFDEFGNFSIKNLFEYEENEKKSVSLNIRNFYFLHNKLNFKFQIGGKTILFNPNKLYHNICDNISCILRRKFSHSAFTKTNTLTYFNRRTKFFENSISHVFFTEKDRKIKTHERKFLNDQSNVRSISFLNISKLTKSIYRNLYKENIKNMELIANHGLYDIAKQIVNDYILSNIHQSNLINLDSYDIPENYGKEKVQSIKKEEGESVFYEFDYGSFTKKYYKISHVNNYIINKPNTICLFGNYNDKLKIGNFHNTLKNLTKTITVKSFICANKTLDGIIKSENVYMDINNKTIYSLMDKFSEIKNEFDDIVSQVATHEIKKEYAYPLYIDLYEINNYIDTFKSLKETTILNFVKKLKEISKYVSENEFSYNNRNKIDSLKSNLCTIVRNSNNVNQIISDKKISLKNISDTLKKNVEFINNNISIISLIQLYYNKINEESRIECVKESIKNLCKNILININKQLTNKTN